MEHNKVFNKIKSDGLLPLFYHDDADVCIALCKALYKGGISCIEFTSRGVNAARNLELIVNERNNTMPGLLIGMGTVTTGEEASIFVAKGADFLVSPFYEQSVKDVSLASGVPYIPGCMTPREIHLANNAGCRLIKLFPGNVLGPEFVQAIKPLFNDIDFIVTGGVENEENNILKWFKSGVVAIGMGSKLITSDIINNKHYDGLAHTTTTLLRYLNRVNQENN